jgi:hypothetical protein
MYLLSFVFVDLRLAFHERAGADPTSVSYNASFVKIYNSTTTSLARFEAQKIILPT